MTATRYMDPLAMGMKHTKRAALNEGSMSRQSGFASRGSMPSTFFWVPTAWSQSRIHRLALQRQYAEDTLVHPVERLLVDETMKRLQAEGKFAQGQ
jgi:hypothetical protein